MGRTVWLLRRLLNTGASATPPEVPRMQRGLPKRTPLAGVRHTVVVASGKGGVGKSTVAVNLAIALARTGYRTGLLDADLYGPSLPRMMRLSPPVQLNSSGLLEPLTNYGVRCMSMGLLVGETAPVIWRGLLVMRGIEQLLRQVAWAPLDVLVIDMPPGTGDTHLSVAQLITLTGALIVTTPQDVAVADARKGAQMFAKVGIPLLGVINNMVSYHCAQCGAEEAIYRAGPDRALEQLLRDEHIRVLATLPIDPALARASDEGVPLVVSAPPGHPTVGEFSRLASTVRSFLESQGKREACPSPTPPPDTVH